MEARSGTYSGVQSPSQLQVRLCAPAYCVDTHTGETEGKTSSGTAEGRSPIPLTWGRAGAQPHLDVDSCLLSRGSVSRVGASPAAEGGELNGSVFGWVCGAGRPRLRVEGRRKAAAAGKVTHGTFRVFASVELTRVGLIPGSAQPPFYGVWDAQGCLCNCFL